MTEAAPLITVLYTGGTFGMTDQGHGLAATPDLEGRLTGVLTGHTDAGSEYRWRYAELETVIDSAEADEHTAPTLAEAIRRQHVLAPEAAGIVVIHGTDTLVHSAARTAFETVGLPVPVVFTGAQIPLGLEGSDAEANVRQAVAAIVEGAARGTSIAFGGALLAAVRATKTSAEEHRAFGTDRPLAEAAIGCAALELPLRRHRRIGTFRFVPGSDAGALRAALAAHPDGLVLECYGVGSGPLGRPGMAEALARAITAGTPVVAITQCRTGGIDLKRYAVSAPLVEAGVLDGGDCTLEAALAKLAALTGRDLTGDALRTAFERNILGEQNATHTA